MTKTALTPEQSESLIKGMVASGAYAKTRVVMIRNQPMNINKIGFGKKILDTALPGAQVQVIPLNLKDYELDLGGTNPGDTFEEIGRQVARQAVLALDKPLRGLRDVYGIGKAISIDPETNKITLRLGYADELEGEHA